MVVGPSGGGKSTLLRCVNLLEVPSEGRVWFEGRDITDIRANLNEVRTHIGIVFQAYNLFPHKTALQNITLALEKVLGLPDDEAHDRAMDQLDQGRDGRTRRTPTRASSPGASSSAWRSRGRWRCSRR